MIRVLVSVSMVGCLLLPDAMALAQTSIYSVHVGVNAPPEDAGLPGLKYADDDAAKMYLFMESVAHRRILASVLDVDSQQLFAGLAGDSMAPQKADLERELATIADEMAVDRKMGRKPILYFSYSGHGRRDGGGTRLALLDGDIDRSWLEEHVLDLPADYIHLMIDACHAEGIVSPRGVITGETDARARKLAEEEVGDLFKDNALKMYPNVGVLMATAVGTESYEWSHLGSGVFTHELLSALSGAADVNFDGDIEYSEVAAFISSANRSVEDRRARPRIVAVPPQLDRNAPVLSLDWVSDPAFLEGDVGKVGRFHLKTSKGILLAEAHPEPGVRMRLLVPTGEKVWMLTKSGVATFVGHSGKTVDLASLVFEDHASASRGSVDDSLRRGLFASKFGPAYYKGWIDQSGGVPVVFPKVTPRITIKLDLMTLESQVDRSAKAPSKALFIGAGISLAGSAVFTGLAIQAKNDFDSTTLQKPAVDARDQVRLHTGLAIGTGALAVALGLVGILLWPDDEDQTFVDGAVVLDDRHLSFSVRF